MAASWEVKEGPVLDVLRSMPSASVHASITSPPYFGLRAYEGDQVVDWPAVDYYPMPGLDAYMAPITIPAMRAALGGESDPLAYIGHLVAVFREVRRVLRADGLLWLNLGDSFAGSWGNYGGRNRGAGTQRPIVNGSQINQRAYADLDSWRPATAGKMAGLKPKDLIGIPSRAALALQADGWYWRSSIPWVKRNGMPDSAGDRPGSAVEWVQLLAVGKRPFYDTAAVELPALQPLGDPVLTGQHKADAGGFTTNGHGKSTLGTNQGPASRRRRNSDWWFDSIRKADAAGPVGAVPGPDGEIIGLDCTVASFPGAHFATWPPALVEPMILASTSARGCCPVCGAPWVRVAEKTDQVNDAMKNSYFDRGKTGQGNSANRAQAGDRYVSETIGWRPSCACSAGVGDFADTDRPATQHIPDPVPAVVLDPFSGSGTTGTVALSLGRRYIGIELSSEYAAMSRERIGGAQPALFGL